MTGRLLTARDVGGILGVHVKTVLSWVQRGELPAIRLPGGAIRIREADLDAWLQRRTVGADMVTTTQVGRAAVSTPPAVTRTT